MGTEASVTQAPLATAEGAELRTGNALAAAVPSYMGTFAEAEAQFLQRYATYCNYQGAVIGTAKELKQHESAKREAELRFMLAGANLAWHKLNNPEASEVLNALSAATQMLEHVAVQADWCDEAEEGQKIWDADIARFKDLIAKAAGGEPLSERDGGK